MNGHFILKTALLSLLVSPLFGNNLLAQESKQSATYTLDHFGPYANPEEAKITYAKALKEIEKAGGGVLLIPATAPKAWNPANSTQGVIRTPAPPAPTQSWDFTPGVTVVDLRGGTAKVMPPQLTGFNLERTFAMPEGQSAPHWAMHPMISFQNNVVRGSTSFLDWLQADVEPGTDRRFYLLSIRGIFPGMFLNGHERDGYSGRNVRLYVKSLGYDKEKKAPYFVADTTIPHKKGAILHNKTHVNVARMLTRAHTELQTFDVMNERHHYSQGDSYLYDATFRYMGNVHSAAGDENGVLYAAFTYGGGSTFNALIESVNPEADEVIFADKGAQHASTLGSGRPLINYNEEKWITGGKVVIVRPGSFITTHEEDPSIKDPTYKGKSYPTRHVKNPVTGNNQLAMGGLIQASADAPWTPDVVGRYFALNEKSEQVPKGGQRRWYAITSFKANPDGTKEIQIERQWWGAKSAGAPTLYHEENYTNDNNIKELRYIIAPGANVYDISKGVINRETNMPYDGEKWERKLLVSPSSDRSTPFDFAPGDKVEQAIGSDPFHPIPFRAWIFDQVPGTFPAPIFDIANNGAVSRSAVLAVRGGKAGGKPMWDNVIDVDSSVRTVINIRGEVRNAAILIDQKEMAPIKWVYDQGQKEASLGLDPKTGRLALDSNGLIVGGGISGITGISATATEARNLRGISVAIPAGVKSFFVKFAKEEADAQYALFLETNWLGRRAITEQKPDGFTVTFSEAVPDKATLHWLLVR